MRLVSAIQNSRQGRFNMKPGTTGKSGVKSKATQDSISRSPDKVRIVQNGSPITSSI